MNNVTDTKINDSVTDLEQKRKSLFKIFGFGLVSSFYLCGLLSNRDLFSGCSIKQQIYTFAL